MEDKIKKVNELLLKGEPDNISEDTYSGFKKSGYSPQYVVDAMNAVFGIDGWGFKDIYNKFANGEVVAKVKVWIGDITISRTAYGGEVKREKQNYGDCKKSAQTDALKKALSYFSVGNRAYHGKLSK